MPLSSPRAALVTLALLAALPPLLPGCADAPGPSDAQLGQIQAALTKTERMTRYAKIRDAAAARGVPSHAFLLAGIAYAETSLAHCWSEATWACQGPDSPDCGGPVIAGAGDGPCSLQQGGLGMFQFDAGTFSDTLAKYGSDVLTIAGNVSHAIDFVVHMVKISDYTTNAETDDKALAWINNFDINNGTLRDQWIKTVTHYYNGCLPSYSCWTQRYNHYNDSLQYVLDDTGLDFWNAKAPDWKATYANQTFPFASQPFVLHPGETKDGYIELKNDGAATWKPGQVFLGTTQPRDVDSPIAGPGWISGHRAATVDQEVPPGQTGRFNFTVKAPNQLGDFPQFFNLVAEGVAWFSDGGQGGPPDDQLEVKVTVEAAPCPAGVGADWVCQGSDRVKCDTATGAVTKETCDNGCAGTPAACSPPSSGAGGAGGAAGTAGSGGSAGAKAGSGGSSGKGGSSGSSGSKAGAGGSSGKGGAAGATGSSGKGGSSGGKAGSGGAPGDAGAPGDQPALVIQNDDGGSEGGCSSSGKSGRGEGAWLGALVALGLLVRPSRPRPCRAGR